MRILSKRKFHFRNGEESVITAGGMTIEDVPEWVAKTSLFRLAVTDQTIVPFEVKQVTQGSDNKEKAEEKAEEKPKAKRTKKKTTEAKK